MTSEARVKRDELPDHQASSDARDFAHTGPGTLAGRFMRQFWLPVHVAEELPPGRAKPLKVLNEEFTLYRGETGTPHVIGPRCAHRRSLLSTGWVRGDSIACHYHGWTYNGSGECVARPAETPADRAPKADIAAYPTRDHLGLIYVYFGEGEPPEFPGIGFEGGGFIDNSVDEFPINFFQCVENTADEVHASFAHSGGGIHAQMAQIPKVSVDETNYGMRRTGQRDSAGPIRVSVHVFPSTVRAFVPPLNGMPREPGWRDSYLAVVPKDDENCYFFRTQHVRIAEEAVGEFLAAREQYRKRIASEPAARDVAQQILDGRLTLADVRDHPRLAVVEDLVAQGGQGRIAERDLEMLGRSDLAVALLRRLWTREMAAISSGEPAKKWVYSGEAPTAGF